jgi:hypothetical protein
MLFSPYLGTGAGRDPQLGDTEPSVRSALRLEDDESYAKRSRRPSSKVEGDISALVGGVQRTMIPPHVLSTIRASTVVSSETGRSYVNNGRVNILHKDGAPDIDALPHELGHAADPGLNDDLSQNADWYKRDPKDPDGNRWLVQAGRPDPREEGIADGFADRFTRLSTASGTPDATATLHADTGYTKGFSGFRDQHARAAYVASRAHASSSDFGHAEIPGKQSLIRGTSLDRGSGSRSITTIKKSGRVTSVGRDWVDLRRSELLKDSTPDKMLVGYMAHENPHVVPHLQAAGLGKAVDVGLSLYRDSHPPRPHPVEFKAGEDAVSARRESGRGAQARALTGWDRAGDRPNTAGHDSPLFKDRSRR